jgi:hypothetical protein
MVKILKKKFNHHLKTTISVGLTVLISVLIIFILVKAGSLTPSAPPAPTSFTLSDIYTRLTTNAPAVLGAHGFTPGGAPASTFQDLTNIYNVIPSINPEKVLTGVNYLGIDGTALKNLWNGTCNDPVKCPLGTEFPGGSNVDGGIDDWNGGSAAPVDRYSKAWTQCNVGNSYCATGLASADAIDNSTGLLWSLPCDGLGCSTFNDASLSTYSWDNSRAINNGKTAAALCSSGDHGQTGWFLPSQKQTMQAYIDGSYGNLETTGVYRYYWSATTASTLTTTAWVYYLSNGSTQNTAKTAAYYVRCVRIP